MVRFGLPEHLAGHLDFVDFFYRGIVRELPNNNTRGQARRIIGAKIFGQNVKTQVLGELGKTEGNRLDDSSAPH